MSSRTQRWYEKISRYLPLASLVCSIALPIILYRFFVTSVREAELRLRSLIVDGTYSSDDSVERWSASVENSGPLPLSNVGLLFRSDAFSRSQLIPCHARRDAAQAKPALCVDIEPPGVDATQSGDAISISFGVMPPNEHRVVTILVPPDADRSPPVLVPGKGHLIPDQVSGWSHSDANPTTPIPWRYGATRNTANFTLILTPPPKSKEKPEGAGPPLMGPK